MKANDAVMMKSTSKSCLHVERFAKVAEYCVVGGGGGGGKTHHGGSGAGGKGNTHHQGDYVERHKTDGKEEQNE